ncbi:MAG TPA: BlaI/MecI/CopY family transcriptional regulator [Candidatus Acidoferrales bacterium]|nr:BlaI/MecI/CopY family transcriptional regulator [Candidatus Acidoferrales bacterium]
MKKNNKDRGLSRRERQIMEALYRLGKASAADIRGALPNPPSYTAVRTHLTILQGKGHVRHRSDGPRYIYEPVVPREEMAKTTIEGVLLTFFGNSVERFVATLLDRKESQISPEQLDRLAQVIERARKEGR